jgi:hypothetical protein
MNCDIFFNFPRHSQHILIVVFSSHHQFSLFSELVEGPGTLDRGKSLGCLCFCNLQRWHVWLLVSGCDCRIPHALQLIN